MYLDTEWNRENIHRLKKEIKLAQQIYPNNAWLDQVLVYCVVEYEMQDFNWRHWDHESENVQANYEELWNNEQVRSRNLITILIAIVK